MEFNRRTFDFSDTEVHFSSCGARVSFKNPSDAAIARLSARKGFTLDAVQAVLDLIVFNPLFDSRQVTFTSASNVDEAVVEHREAQILRRASVGGEETSPTSGATSPRAISLVVSQIERDMEPFSEFVHHWVLLDRPLRIARNMSLVHRSWTVPAQGLLFHRMLIYRYKYQLLRNLLQNPFCSIIRELHFEVSYAAHDNLRLFVRLLPRLSSLRKLSIGVDYVIDGKDHDNLWAKIYSEILPRLPNLVELRIRHIKFIHLEDCAKCILQCGSGAAPFVLKSISILDGGGVFESEMILSPENVHPIVRHETSHCPSAYSSPQARDSAKISRCPIITVSISGRLQTGSYFARLFDTGGVFEDVYPHISHFDLQHVDWNPPLDDADPVLADFLGRCTSLTHMNVFPSELGPSGLGRSNPEMTDVPFSSISKSLQVLSIYCRPQNNNDAEVRERASGLERGVRTLCDREAGSSLERIEVTFCSRLYWRLAIEWRTSKLKSYDMAPPECMDPVRRICHEQGIDLVCKILE